MKTNRARRPSGRWVYYILYDGILWPCPVRWEWESSYGGWLPFYYSPTFEFIAGDPAKAWRITKSNVRHTRHKQSVGATSIARGKQNNYLDWRR